jgi:hypothetical protein
MGNANINVSETDTMESSKTKVTCLLVWEEADWVTKSPVRHKPYRVNLLLTEQKQQNKTKVFTMIKGRRDAIFEETASEHDVYYSPPTRMYCPWVTCRVSGGSPSEAPDSRWLSKKRLPGHSCNSPNPPTKERSRSCCRSCRCGCMSSDTFHTVQILFPR